MIYLSALFFLIPVVVIEAYSIVKNRKSKVTTFLILGSGLLLVVELIVRSIGIGFPALTNTFEALVFFSSVILVIMGVMKFRNRVNSVLSFGSASLVVIFLLICSSPLIPKSLNPPIPALQSNWLLLHVSFAFIGQSFFVISFVAAIASLRSRSNREKYRSLTLNSIIIGYPFYTAGAIIFGSIWASSAWGSFWSWDPKETWALITWFIYTIILHGRFTKYIKDKMISWLSITGFAVSLFTFLGVNFLLSSLHSYN